MWKLQEALPKPRKLLFGSFDEWPEPERLIGLEFEFENVLSASKALQQMEYQQYWGTHPEGSLQNHGVEFVTNDPILVAHARPLVEDFLAVAAKRKFDPSWRAGIHVHIQTTDLDSDRLLRLFMLYALYEPMLFGYIGNDRANTRFCKPWWCSYVHLVKFLPFLAQDYDEKSGKLPAITTEMRYSALNLAALWKYGTLEFRHLEATLEPQRVMNWLHLLMMLYSASANEEFKPSELMRLHEEMGTRVLGEHIFGPHLALMPEMDIEQGVLSLITLRTAVEDALTVPEKSWEALANNVVGENDYVKRFLAFHSKPKRKRGKTKVKKEV